jgi:flavin-dependent dehydrogenase
MDFDCEVLVVGAGLAGLWSALGLARQGFRVRLIDHKSEVGGAVSTTGIFVRRSLESFRLPAECLGPPVRHVVLHSPGGRSIGLASLHDEFRVGRMAELYRHLLAEAVLAGVEWSPATQFVDAAPWGAGSAVTLRRGGASIEVRTRFLIGADGARSRVAPTLGLSQNSRWIVGAEEVMRGVPSEGPACFHCVLDPRLAPGYLGWLVHDGEEVHLGVAGYSHRFNPRAALELLRTRMKRVLPLDQGEVVDRRGGWIPVNGVLPAIVNSRGLLLGDAAGAVSPLTAGGLDPCLRLSALAVRQISAYLASQDRQALALLEGRRFRRRFRGRLVLRRAWDVMRSRWTMELACALLATGPGRLVAERVLFNRGSFPDLTSDGECDHGSRTAHAAAVDADRRTGDRRSAGAATAAVGVPAGQGGHA